MSIHLIQRRKGYGPAIAAAQPGDAIVLLGEGVAAVLDGASNCFAAAGDLHARGLNERADKDVARISDAELVELCCQHAPCVTWTG